MSLELSDIELGRLAIMQRAPWRAVERRVESLEFKDDRHYSVTVRQQVTVSRHRPKEAEERDLLIPLGQFSKARRPDMEVIGPDGSPLPILHHDARGKAIAVLVTTSWQKTLFPDKNTRQEQVEKLADVWNIIQYHVEQVAKRSRDSAHEIINRFRPLLRRLRDSSETNQPTKDFIDRLLKASDLWRELRVLAETTIRIAELRGIPGETYIITIRYTERFGYGLATKGVLRRFLSLLGLDSIPVSRNTANIGHARSLWVIHSVPDGLEPLRLFWGDERDNPSKTDIGKIENDRAVVGRRTDSDSPPQEQDDVLLDFQIAPTASVFAAMALAFMLLFVGAYVYQRTPSISATGERTLLVSLATALAAVPATITGVLAYRGQTFIRRASQGPRILLALLSGQASFLAVVLGLKTGRGHALLEISAFVLAVYSLFIFGMFGYIRFGPRWRKSSRSRRPKLTKRLSPDQCRDRQMWAALLFCVTWVLVVIVFARSISVLQHQSVFSHEFPGNVWRAWWSWFS